MKLCSHKVTDLNFEVTMFIWDRGYKILLTCGHDRSCYICKVKPISYERDCVQNFIDRAE
jgi:hypothetical protein